MNGEHVRSCEKRHSSEKNAIYTMCLGGKKQERRNISLKPVKSGVHLDRSIVRVQRDIYRYITDLSFLSL